MAHGSTTLKALFVMKIPCQRQVTPDVLSHTLKPWLSVLLSMMINDVDNCIVLSSDRSSNSGVGSYVVQSLIINGVPRTLPTLAVCSETREVLADLQKCILDMLVASADNKYSHIIFK